MKSGARVLALASGPIYGRRRKRTLIVGVVGRAGIVEGILSGKITIDGNDSAQEIASLFRKSRFKEQIKAIAVNGIAMAGLNVIDVHALERKTRVPVLILTRQRPNVKEFMKAIAAYSKLDSEGAHKKRALVRLINKERSFVKMGGFYLQSGLKPAELRPIADVAFSMLRLAHMVARGVATGVSRGRV